MKPSLRAKGIIRRLSAGLRCLALHLQLGGTRSLLARALAFVFCPKKAKADYTVIDSGTSQTFAAAVTNAVSCVWTLDGTVIGTGNSTFGYTPDVNAVGTHDLFVVQTLLGGNITATEWGVRVQVPVPASSIRVYIASTGADSESGSFGSPSKTLKATQAAVRALPHPLPAGGVTYYLTSSF